MVKRPEPSAGPHSGIEQLRRRCDASDQAQRECNPSDHAYLRYIDYRRSLREDLLTCPSFVTAVDVMPEADRQARATEFFELLCNIQQWVKRGLMSTDARSWRQQFLPWEEKREEALKLLADLGALLEKDATLYALRIGRIAQRLRLEKEPPEHRRVPMFNPEHIARAGGRRGGASDSLWFGLFVKELAEYVPEDVKTRGTTKAAVIAELLRAAGVTDATSRRINSILTHAEVYSRKRN